MDRPNRSYYVLSRLSYLNIYGNSDFSSQDTHESGRCFLDASHYRKKYDKYMNFSTGWYACKVFLPPLGAIILNFSTMVQLTL